MFKVVQKVTANVPTFGVLGHPCSKLHNLQKIRRANSVTERLRQRLGVLRRANLALVSGCEDEIQRTIQALALERLPFPFVEPHAAGGRTAVDVEWKTVANPLAE